MIFCVKHIHTFTQNVMVRLTLDHCVTVRSTVFRFGMARIRHAGVGMSAVGVGNPLAPVAGVLRLNISTFGTFGITASGIMLVCARLGIHRSYKTAVSIVGMVASYALNRGRIAAVCMFGMVARAFCRKTAGAVVASLSGIRAIYTLNMSAVSFGKMVTSRITVARTSGNISAAAMVARRERTRGFCCITAASVMTVSARRFLACRYIGTSPIGAVMGCLLYTSPSPRD